MSNHYSRPGRWGYRRHRHHDEPERPKSEIMEEQEKQTQQYWKEEYDHQRELPVYFTCWCEKVEDKCEKRYAWVSDDGRIFEDIEKESINCNQCKSFKKTFEE